MLGSVKARTQCLPNRLDLHNSFPQPYPGSSAFLQHGDDPSCSSLAFHQRERPCLLEHLSPLIFRTVTFVIAAAFGSDAHRDSPLKLA